MINGALGTYECAYWESRSFSRRKYLRLWWSLAYSATRCIMNIRMARRKDGEPGNLHPKTKTIPGGINSGHSDSIRWWLIEASLWPAMLCCCPWYTLVHRVLVRSLGAGSDLNCPKGIRIAWVGGQMVHLGIDGLRASDMDDFEISRGVVSLFGTCVLNKQPASLVPFLQKTRIHRRYFTLFHIWRAVLHPDSYGHDLTTLIFGTVMRRTKSRHRSNKLPLDYVIFVNILDSKYAMVDLLGISPSDKGASASKAPIERSNESAFWQKIHLSAIVITTDWVGILLVLFLIEDGDSTDVAVGRIDDLHLLSAERRVYRSSISTATWLDTRNKLLYHPCVRKGFIYWWNR